MKTMNMIKRGLVALAAMVCMALPARAGELTVADGGQMNMNIPLSALSGYTSYPHHSQSIYPASMLTSIQGQYITSLRYYCTQPSPQFAAAVTVSLGTTSASTFGSDALLGDAVTEVFSGHIVPIDGGYSFVLSSPWLYEGGNLLVDIQTDGGGQASLGFHYGLTQSNASCYSTTTYSPYTGRQNFLPKLTLGYSSDNCGVPSALTIDSIGVGEALVSWAPAASAMYYIVCSDGFDYPAQLDTVAILEWLGLGEDHTFCIKAVCTSGDTTVSPSLSFYMPDTATTLALPYCEDFEHGEANGLPRWWRRIDSCAYQGLMQPRIYQNVTVHGGTASMQMRANDCATLTAATVPLPAAANELHVSFWYSSLTSYGNPPIKVGVIDSAGVFHLAASLPVSDNGWHYADIYTDSLTVGGTVSLALRWESYYNLAIDDLCIERVAYCPRPVELAIDSLDSTTAYLHITPAALGDAILVYLDGALEQTVFDTVAVLDGLVPGRVHHVEVRTLCPMGDESQPLATEVRMPCADMLTLPWSEDFDDLPAGPLPDCFTIFSQVEPDPGSYSPLVFPDVSGSQGYGCDPHSGTRMMRMGMSDQQMALVATQPIAGANRLRISFWYLPHTYNTHNVRAGFIPSLADTASFVEVFVSPVCSSSGEWEWKHVEILTETLSVALPDTACFAIKMPTYMCFIDDISIESVVDCPQPTNVHAAYIGPTAATIDWEPSSADSTGQAYRVLLDGEVYASLLTVSECHLTGLESDHTYTVEVQAVCSNGTMGPLQSVQFTTNCPAATLPMEERFGDGAMPACWQVLREPNTTGWNMYPRVDTYDGHDSVGSLEFYAFSGSGSGDNIVLSPMFAVPSTGLYVRFWSQHGFGDGGTLNVGLIHDASEVYFFTPLLGIDMSGNSFQWQENTILTTGLTPSDSLRLVFRLVGVGDFSIDDLIVMEMPTCLRPNDPSVDIVGYDSVVLSWSGDTTLYEVMYDTSATGATALSLTVSDTSATLHGLEPYTTYYAWVRALCSDVDSSEWLAIGPFTTDCAPLSLPYTAAFGTYTRAPFPPCWRQYASLEYDYIVDPSFGLEPAYGPWHLYWSSADKAEAAPGIWLPFGDYDKWLVTPLIALDSAARLSFDMVFLFGESFNAPDSISEDIRFGVAVSTDNAASWSILSHWGGSGDSNLLHVMHEMDNHVELTLDGGPANIRVGFYAISNHGIIHDNWDDLVLIVDNIGIVPLAPVDTTAAPDTVPIIDTIPDIGIAAVAEAPTVALVPNPATDHVEVQCSTAATVELLDLQGSIVIPASAVATTHRLDLAALPSGTYFVRIRTASGATMLRKLLVAR